MPQLAWYNDKVGWIVPRTSPRGFLLDVRLKAAPYAIASNVWIFPPGGLNRKRDEMFSLKHDVKEPVQQASLASVLALGLALLALGVAFAAMAKLARSSKEDTWTEVTD